MKVYATTNAGDRVLVRLECDATGCDATIRPGPEIATSGWVRGGRGFELDGEEFCEDHQDVCSERYGHPDDHQQERLDHG